MRGCGDGYSHPLTADRDNLPDARLSRAPRSRRQRSVRARRLARSQARRAARSRALVGEKLDSRRDCVIHIMRSHFIFCRDAGAYKSINFYAGLAPPLDLGIGRHWQAKLISQDSAAATSCLLLSS